MSSKANRQRKRRKAEQTLLYQRNRKARFAMRASLIRAGKRQFDDQRTNHQQNFITNLDVSDPQQPRMFSSSSAPAGSSTFSKTTNAPVKRRKISKLGSDVETSDTDEEEHLPRESASGILTTDAERKSVPVVERDCIAILDEFSQCNMSRNNIIMLSPVTNIHQSTGSHCEPCFPVAFVEQRLFDFHSFLSLSAFEHIHDRSFSDKD